MGFIYRQPITADQQRENLQEQHNKIAFDDLQQQLNDEKSARSAKDSEISNDISTLQENLNAEIDARSNSQNTIQADLNTEKNAREAADSDLQIAIGAEIITRENADDQLRAAFTTAINNEISARTQSIADMQAAILASIGDNKALEAIENEKLREQIEEAAANQSANLTALTNRLNTEETTRAKKDTELQGAISAEIQDRKTAISNVQSALTSAVNNEISARKTADSALQENIDAEAQTRAAEDSKLQGAISTEIQDRKDAVSSLKTTLTSSITSETTARQNADNQLKSDLTALINSETSNRNSAIAASEQSTKNYVDAQVASVSDNLNDFTAPTTTEAGKRGLVPAPAAGADLKLLTNYGWRSAGDTTLTISNVPTQATVLTFNNANQSPTWLNFDDKKLKIEGTTSGKDAKTYEVTFTPIDIYLWEDTLDQSPKTATWKIEPLKLAKPTASVTNFTYNGKAQGITVSNFDSTYESQTGTTSATNVNSYSATYKLRNTTNTKWSDNSTADVVISWKINVLLLDKPTAATTEFDYDGNTKNLSISNFNSDYESQTGTTSASAVGDYSVSFTLKNTTNTKWADSSTGTVTVSWKIVQRVLTAAQSSGFEQVGTLTYNGNSQTVSIKNYDSDYHVLSSETSKVDAGTYTAKISPKSGYKWSDGSENAKTVTWKINPKTITKPTAAVTSFDYDGNAKTLQVSGFDTSYMNQVTGSTLTASAVGNYYVKYSLKSTTNYIWEGNTTADVTINWSIGNRVLTAAQSSGFVQVGTLTYTGGSQTVTIQNYDSEVHVLSSTTSAVNATTYTAKISPRSGCVWNDKTSTPKDVTWKINPAPVTRPKLSGTTSFTFDNTEKSVKVDGFDSSVMTQDSGSVTSATNSGDYSISFSLKNSNYQWATTPETTKTTLTWTIDKAAILIYTPDTYKSTTSWEYDSTTHSIPVMVNGSDAANEGVLWERTGTSSATDAGDYSVVYKLKYPQHSMWLLYGTNPLESTTNNITFTWKITPVKLTSEQSRVYLSKPTLYYNQFVERTTSGPFITEILVGYDSNYHVLSGGINPTGGHNNNTNCYIGDYTAYVSPAKNYAWADGTVTPKQLDWKLDYYFMAIPTLEKKQFEYNGNVHEVTLYNFAEKSQNDVYRYCELYKGSWTLPEGKTITSTWSATAVGVYTGVLRVLAAHDPNIKMSGINGENWNTYTFEILGESLSSTQSTFSQEGTLTYNGLKQTVTIKNFDSSVHTLSGTTSAVNAGFYTANVTPASNLTWDTGGSEAKSVTWSINANELNAPTAVETNFTYDGDLKSLNIIGYNPTYMNQSGVTSATEAGSYSVTYSLKNKTNTCWAGGSTDDITINWKIGMTTVAAPVLTSATFTYDGNLKTPAFSGVNNSLMVFSSETSATNAGNHTVIVSLANPDITVWDDSTNAPKTYVWKINRKPLSATQSTFAQSGTLNFNGSSQNVTITNFNANYHVLSGTTQAQDAGTYTVKIAPNNNYCFNDGTTAAKTVSWNINSLKLTKPTAAATSFIYDKQPHTLTLQNFNSDYVQQTGTISATEPNGYSTIFTLKNSNNTQWADNSIEDVIIRWSISKRTLTKPTATQTVFDMNGTQKTLQISNFDSNYMTQSGTISEKVAGDYQAVFSLKDSSITQWEDLTVDDVVIDWKINRKKMTMIESNLVQKTIPTVTGSNINITATAYVKGYNSTKQVWSGVTYSKDAGTFTAYVSPSANYAWFDGTVLTKTFTWKIDPAQIDLPVLDTSVTLTYDGDLKTIPLNGYDSNKMTLSGDFQKTDAGDYTAKVTPTSNYIWEDSTQSAREIVWTIERQKLSISKSDIKGDLNSNYAIHRSYSGEEYNALNYLKNFDEKYMTISGTVKATNAVQSSVHITMKNNYAFSDGSIIYSMPVLIDKLKINKPKLSTTEYTYTGNTITPEISYSTILNTLANISGTRSASAKGSYNITFSLKDKTGANYTWADNSVDDIVLGWSIGMQTITAPTLAQDYFDFSGSTIAPSISGFDSATMTKSGTESAKNRGFYKITVKLKDKTGTCWSTGGNADIVFEWAIGKKRIAKPELNSDTEFTYNGSAKKITVTGYDANTMNQSGYLSATDAGDYSVSFSLLTGTGVTYVWQDDSTTPVTFNWKINKAALPAVTFYQTNTPTYDGNLKTVTIKNYDASKHDISGSTATSAGDYSAQITPKANYCWQDSTVTAKNVSWKINPKLLVKPSAAETAFDYTGSEQNLTISNFDSTYESQTGTTSATTAGSYSVTFKLKDKTNTRWQDGSVSDVVISWRIGKTIFEIPTLTPARQTFNGTDKIYSVSIENFVASAMTKTGTDSILGQNAKTSQTVTISLNDTENSAWSGNSTDDIVLTWYIDPYVLSEEQSGFVQDNVITYDGNSHTGKEAFSWYDENYFTYHTGDNTTTWSAAAAGTYKSVMITNPCVKFSDGTTSKEFTWTISKATPKITLSSDNITLNDANFTANVTVTTNSTGAINVTSQNTDVATAEYNSTTKTIKINAVSAGQTVLTVTQLGDNNFNQDRKFIAVKSSVTIDMWTWKFISDSIKAGATDNFVVGDSKLIKIEGTVGTLTINDYYRAVLIGIDHNSGVEGANRLHFAIMKNSDNTKNIAFTDSEYASKGTTNAFRHTTRDGSGQPVWLNSALRTRCSELFNALPSELQSVITACKKYFFSQGQVNSVSDKVWLPSVYEIDGKTNSAGIPVAYLKQYDYFANGNSRVCYKHNSQTTTAIYWTRDALLNTTDGHFFINTAGNSGYTSPNFSYGFLPCFTIGG